MCTPVPPFSPMHHFNTALEQMQTYGVRRLVVVGLDSRIIGLVTLHQLIADRQRRYLAVLQANLQDREEQQFPASCSMWSVTAWSRRGGHRPDRQDQPQLSDWLGYREADTPGMTLADIAPNPPNVGGRRVRAIRRPCVQGACALATAATSTPRFRPSRSCSTGSP